MEITEEQMLHEIEEREARLASLTPLQREAVLWDESVTLIRQARAASDALHDDSSKEDIFTAKLCWAIADAAKADWLAASDAVFPKLPKLDTRL